MVAGIFAGMPADAAVAIGYAPEPFCIDGRVVGAPQVGTMGFHYINEALIGAPLNPLAPAVLLVHPTDGTVTAVEYTAADTGGPRPSLFGQDFDPPMPPQIPFFSLHLWAVDNPGGMFANFNPGLPLCAAGSLPPAPPDTGDTGVVQLIRSIGLAGVLALVAGLPLLVWASRRRRSASI
jgi:hypothetical protein